MRPCAHCPMPTEAGSSRRPHNNSIPSCRTDPAQEAVMIIDCHGHYTTAPKALEMFRKAQIAALNDPSAPSRSLQISDDQVRETLVPAQLKLQQGGGAG